MREGKCRGENVRHSAGRVVDRYISRGTVVRTGEMIRQRRPRRRRRRRRRQRVPAAGLDLIYNAPASVRLSVARSYFLDAAVGAARLGGRSHGAHAADNIALRPRAATARPACAAPVATAHEIIAARRPTAKLRNNTRSVAVCCDPVLGRFGSTRRRSSGVHARFAGHATIAYEVRAANNSTLALSSAANALKKCSHCGRRRRVTAVDDGSTPSTPPRRSTAIEHVRTRGTVSKI